MACIIAPVKLFTVLKLLIIEYFSLIFSISPLAALNILFAPSSFNKLNQKDAIADALISFMSR